VSYVVCRGCGAAKNPKSKLTFHETEEQGWLCGNCFNRWSSQSELTEEKHETNLVVVVCPSCGGKGKANAPKFERCTTCIGFGSVQVAQNALAVFRPRTEEEPAEPQVLTEG